MITPTGKVFLQIDLQPQGPWIHSNWIGYPTHENVAKGAFKYLDWMREKGCTAVLNDNRQLVGRWDQSLDWLEQNWIPYAVKTGLKYWAHLDNLSALSANSADQLQERVKGKFEVKLFDDQTAAESWLRDRLKARR
ncbi:STAS/SEC14 domain-containing protein [Rufibacter sediminis]|uniref:STAS/SEC14 domain-containing protein n=1 Tax=Rufibacter sediminis TaxID=2762756 RepID=A0ABR6VN99_9BACT|nr:STAS/SEC14 domain-containing protein [Rufibacter sediminis]MBC3538387.1 STAS/SEC14 domain-containing protein [Rufibacter sediminis]